jgi:hypothetical protein
MEYSLTVKIPAEERSFVRRTISCKGLYIALLSTQQANILLQQAYSYDLSVTPFRVHYKI